MDCHSRKEFLALLLALLLALFAPMTAWAEEEEEEVPDSNGTYVVFDDAEENPNKDSEDSDEGSEAVVEVTPAAASVSPSAVLLNSAKLNPVSPQSQALDSYLDSVMADILTDDLDTYGQIKACYDYLVATVSYGSHMSRLDTVVTDGVTCRSIYNNYGAVEGFGAVALTAKQGMCNAYNSAFILMARKIGLDANLVKGYTRGAGGSYVYHEWTEMTIDGIVYVFDPQLEQNLVASGLPRYSVFCKTYDQVGGRYSK